ncbi:MAG: hypothetical protein M2R45_00125 [Verrucomicrobia subdivision 3 bacterium]|nr:hypothetical protein [Limisphaerales bacterium]MCS1412415.1 hypothetical protein [Limisphaerales bacterium]
MGRLRQKDGLDHLTQIVVRCFKDFGNPVNIPWAGIARDISLNQASADEMVPYSDIRANNSKLVFHDSLGLRYRAALAESRVFDIEFDLSKVIFGVWFADNRDGGSVSVNSGLAEC